MGSARNRSRGSPSPAWRVASAGHLGKEGPPRERLLPVPELLGAVVVVEALQQRLIEGRRGSQAVVVIRVALDLGGPALVALDDEASGVPFERMRGREVERVSRRDLFGAAHEGDALLLRGDGTPRRHRPGLHPIRAAA